MLCRGAFIGRVNGQLMRVDTFGRNVRRFSEAANPTPRRGRAVSKTAQDWWKNEILLGFPRSRILLRGALVRKRLMFNPFIMKREVRSLGDIAGHLSFMMLAVSYTETDVFNLRFYAVAGISLSIVFQYYREKPLYLPIRWNFLFLTINAAMMAVLVKQSIEAASIPDEQKKLYTSLFQEKGMHSVEFMQLMSIAKRKEFDKGEYLAKQGAKRDRLYLIVKGKGKVVRDGDQIAAVGEHQFVGEMSYLAWEAKMRKAKAKERESDKSAAEKSTEIVAVSAVEPGIDAAGAVASSAELAAPVAKQRGWAAWGASWLDWAGSPAAAAGKSTDESQVELTERAAQSLGVADNTMVGTASVITTEPSIVYTFEFEDLHKIIRKSETIGTVFERCLSSGLNKKLVASISSGPEKRYKEMMVHFLVQKPNPRGDSCGDSAGDDDVTSNAKTTDGTRDVMDGCNKAVEVLTTLSSREIDFLEAFRKKNKITDDFKNTILRECGWTSEEFHQGHRGRPSRDDLDRYAKEVHSELDRLAKVRATQLELRDKHLSSSAQAPSKEASSGWWGSRPSGTPDELKNQVLLGAATKERFMKIRKRDQITYAQHLEVLGQKMWTGDDYERGCLQQWADGQEYIQEGTSRNTILQWFR